MKTTPREFFFRPGTVEWDSCLRWWACWSARVLSDLLLKDVPLNQDEEIIEALKSSIPGAVKVVLRRNQNPELAWLREQSN